METVFVVLGTAATLAWASLWLAVGAAIVVAR